MMKECMKPHAAVHILTGVGVGLLIAGVVPSFGTVTYGLVVIVVGVVLDYIVQNKKG